MSGICKRPCSVYILGSVYLITITECFPNYALESCKKLKNSCLQVELHKCLRIRYVELLVKFQIARIYVREVLQSSTLTL